MRKLMTQFVIVMIAAATTMLYFESRLLPRLLVRSSVVAGELKSKITPSGSIDAPAFAPGTDPRSHESGDQRVALADEGGPQPNELTDGFTDTGASGPLLLPPDVQEYGELYGAMSPPEMRAECEHLSEKVMLTLTEAARERMVSGEYEVVGYGNMAPQVAEDRAKLVTYQLVPVPARHAREIRKIELLEADYPETYDQHRRAIWLSEQLRNRTMGGAE